jgi:hypothetical protein
MADMYMNCTFWQRPAIISDQSQLKPRTQALYYDNEIGTNLLFTTCHNSFKTEIFTNQEHASLQAHSNCILDTCKKVLSEEYPEFNSLDVLMPDESNRRVGQSIAAASLPKSR